MIPQSNATLLQVREPDTQGQDWEDPDTDGNPLWNGQARVYLRENEDRLRRGEAGDVILRRTLLVHPLDPPVEWATGQEIQVRRDRGGLFVGTIGAVARPASPPGFTHVGTRELILREA